MVRRLQTENDLLKRKNESLTKETLEQALILKQTRGEYERTAMEAQGFLEKIRT
jgi:hypothetical protein